jgi:hypothetical protein
MPEDVSIGVNDAMYWWNFNPLCNIWDVVKFES